LHRRKYTKILILFIAATLFFESTYAQNGEVRTTNEAEGYSFVAPKGWASNATAEGYAFVEPGQNIILVVKAHNYRDHNAFIADANLEKDGLQLVGGHQDIRGGKIFRTSGNTPQGLAIIDTAVVYRSDGGGVAIVALTDNANSERGFNTALAVANSMTFRPPQVSAVAQRVRQGLTGKQLTYLYTGSGYSERKDIVLCSNGTFYQSTGMGGFSPGNSDGGSFAARGGHAGSWSIAPNGGSLLLRFNSGGTTSYTLSARQASNEVGLNGQRFFIQSQNVCQ